MTIVIERTVVYIETIMHVTISTILQILTTAADSHIHSKAMLLLHTGKMIKDSKRISLPPQ